MKKEIRIALAAWVIVLIILATVRISSADFQGLAPGDYTLTLNGSLGLCSSGCTGTIHNPTTNSTLDADFGWVFVVAQSIGSPTITFDWTVPLNTSISPNTLNSCAFEGTGSCTADDVTNTFQVIPNMDSFFLGYTAGPDPVRRWGGWFGENNVISTAFTWNADEVSASVPDPTTLVLMTLSPIVLVGCWAACIQDISWESPTTLKEPD